jgi:hypothetical protein
VDVKTRKESIVVLTSRVEVHAVRCAIRIAFPFEIRNERDLLGDMIGGAAPVRGLQQIQRAPVVHERFCVALRDGPRRFARALAAYFHLVLALVGVGDKMADIGDIHDMPDVVAVQCQHASQHVLENICSKIPDMRMVVHRGAAAVQTDVIRVNGRELARRARPGIVKNERHVISSASIA